ncbi:phosphopantetheine-binding protein [Streptomyces sp. ML-6]|uniref:phosphopantetheine-binding protein n=1 Tax=Streptomyces sp. ML-6 TaxID=2982693 RepID=UPI0024BF5C4F|nr:phosphopantetheine-binding protein [Streptomyces sp. ML-6]MDK0517984.1 phosphopantetheine-binding protein [Streptomyces sp. ML-6]
MTEQVEPDTGELTSMVHSAWETVLEHSDFDPDSDFFAVGGNSFLVAKVMADLSKQVGVRLPLRLFFATPTVHGIARAVAEQAGSRCR